MRRRKVWGVNLMSIVKYYPETAEKLNWGALFLTPIWLIIHKKYLMAAMALVPVLGFGVSVYSCINGGRWAWDSKRWENELMFDESVSKWNAAGFVVLVTLAILHFVTM